MSNTTSPDPALRARVLAAAAHEQSPTRSRVRWRILTIIAVFVALVLAEFIWVGGMRDWGMPRSPLLIIATMTGLVGLACASTYLALDRDGAMLGRPAQHLWFMIVISPLGFFMWKVVWSSVFAGALEPWPSRVGHKCLGLVVTMGLLLVAGYSLAFRRERARPALSGAAMGVAAGVSAAVLVELWCPVGHPLHVFYGHIAPMFVVAIFGVALARALSHRS